MNPSNWVLHTFVRRLLNCFRTRKATPMKNVTYNPDTNKINITIDLNEPSGAVTKRGNVMLAQSSGWEDTGVQFNGMPIGLTFSAIARKPQ